MANKKQNNRRSQAGTTALKWIVNRAKKIYASKDIKWTDAIKQASAEYRRQ